MNKYKFGYLVARIPRIPENVFNEVKYFLQRGKRGYSDRDTWSLDWYLSGVLSGSLKYISNHTYSSSCRYFNKTKGVCPKDCDCFELWKKELLDNAEKFRLIKEDKWYEIKPPEKSYEEEEKTLKETEEWLGKNFHNLSW